MDPKVGADLPGAHLVDCIRHHHDFFHTPNMVV
jgi:hypothetical protein